MQYTFVQRPSHGLAYIHTPIDSITFSETSENPLFDISSFIDIVEQINPIEEETTTIYTPFSTYYVCTEIDMPSIIRRIDFLLAKQNFQRILDNL